MKSMLMKAQLVLIIVISFGFSAHSQQKLIDSLELVIKNTSGISKYEPLFELIRVHARSGNYEEVLNAAREARIVALQNEDTAKIVQSSRVVGQVLNFLLRHEEAESILLKMLPIAKRHNLNEDYSIILNNLALVYSYQARYDRALDFNFQALDIRRKNKDESAISISLQNIGFVYYKLKEYNKGLSYYKQALKLRRTIKDDWEVEQILVNISLCYAYLDDFSTAKAYADSAVSYCGNKKCTENALIDANLSLGIIHHGLKKIDDAERFFLKSYRLAQKLNHVRYQFDNIDYLSEIYIQRNQIKKAVHYLEAAEALIQQDSTFNPEMIKIYSRFFQMYNKMKNYERAALYQQKYIQLRDSIYNDELTTNLMKLEAEHLEKENQARIEAQNEILNLKEEVIERQRLLTIFITAFAIIFVLLAILLLKSNRQKQRINRILDKKVKERTFQLESNHHSLLQASRERSILIEQTVADIKSSLATIKGLCSIGIQDTTEPHVRQYITKVDVTSDQLASTLRNLQAMSKVV